MIRRSAAAALAAILAAGLSGCGIADRVVGTREIPIEQTGGAPLSEQTATAIAGRVLAAVAAAPTSATAKADAERATVMTGPALATADAAARLGVRPPGEDVLTVPKPPRVLALSKGPTWPRWILVTTLDEATSTQSLHVLTSRSATAPFELAASVPMAPGSAVPSLGDIAGGATPISSSQPKLPARPEAVLTAYAAALAYPKAKTSTLVTTKDALATDLKANATKLQESKGFKGLATLTQKHEVADGDAGKPVGFALAGGGAVVFGQLVRTDTITLTAKAKELPLPSEFAKLAKKSKITKSLRIRSLENIVMVIPASGAASVIGADEQRLDASGS